ncbi:MAG: bacteriohopanetetrol glucosamine biosynthesis glycosyltransferase HpnI [Sphingomonadales bacterium]|nr:bacteriohopanetetrol glucosamine biosynthesis glycosyltransferase HpnI [Sphingomonadales bacterium]
MVSPTVIHALGLITALLAAAASVYQLIVVHTFRRWFARPCPEDRGHAAVTLLKPLHGPEPELAENLATFLTQDHAGPVQMLCGVNQPGDAALAVARGLAPVRAQDEITLWPGPRAAGANGKIGNLVAMMPQARHPLLVLSDSDMAVGPDYLPKVLGALRQPGVGVVSCLYLGRGDAGRWSEIGAAAISYAMMPNMTLALHFGLSQPCMGSTIALRRETLDAIGGFERFVDVLADDYAIGMAVCDTGLSVAVPPMLVTHACEEPTWGALWRHHLRWAVTLRSIVGIAHGGTLITHALPLAVLAALFQPRVGLGLIGAALAARWLVKATVDRQAGHSSGTVIDLVLSDFVGFFVFLASLTARTIDWRGHRLTMAGDGRIRSRPAPAP